MSQGIGALQEIDHRRTGESSEEPKPQQKTAAAKHTETKPPNHRRSHHSEESQGCRFGPVAMSPKVFQSRTSRDKLEELIARGFQAVEAQRLYLQPVPSDPPAIKRLRHLQVPRRDRQTQRENAYRKALSRELTRAHYEEDHDSYPWKQEKVMGQKSSRRGSHPCRAKNDVASALAPDERNPSRGKHPEPQERVHMRPSAE